MNQDILSDVKLVKRHNAAGVIIGILAILSVAVPVVLWIFPWFAFSISDINTASGYSDGMFMMTIIDPILKLFNQPNLASDYIIHNGYVSMQIRENVLNYYLMREMLYAPAIWYFLSAFWAIVLLIQGLVLLIRGRLNHPGSIVVSAFFAFLANGFLLLDAFKLSWYMKWSMTEALKLTEYGTEFGYVTIYWYNFIIMGVAGGIWLIMLILHLACIRGRYFREDIEFVDVDPEPFEKNDGLLRNTLPQGLTSIGGHAFSKNTNLEIASIPDGISELGVGAFSNCLRLKVVTIPASVKMIGANCFFNTEKLKRINYGGTKEQWRKVKRGSNWLERSATTTVICSDGALSVNPKN